MIMVTVTKYGVTVGYLDLLQMILITLKLQQIISVNWFIVLLPYIALTTQSLIFILLYLADGLEK